MVFLEALLASIAFGFAMMGWNFFVCLALERAAPKDRPSVDVQMRALKFWFFYGIVGMLVGASFDLFRQSLGVPTFYIISLHDHLPLWSLYLAGPLAGMAIYDFFNYWMHRAQHKWFWAQHAVHHSIRDLSAVNSYMHWTEELFRLVFISIPMAYVLGIDAGGATLISGLILSAYGNFLHSASSIHFGKIGRLVFADNRWHRIHHSIEVEHYDKNFGTGVTFWDRLFGTAYYPENHEWPQTGVHDVPEITTLDDYLWRPFRGANSTPEAAGLQKTLP